MKSTTIHTVIVTLIGLSTLAASAQSGSSTTDVRADHAARRETRTVATADNAVSDYVLASNTVIITPPAAAEAAPPAKAETPQSPEDKKRAARNEFNKLVGERNGLHERLGELDAKALKAVKEGDRPVQVHAEQISVQDKIDLISLRLEMLAMRYDLDIPPLPSEQQDEQEGDDGAATFENRIDEFNRGTQRTLDKLREQTLEVLGSLDLRGYLRSRRAVTP